ncbi:potassium channel family protein [Salisediminibacterium halotolerans]|uniref:potassium channel family protein n=1 Tax=Salisediminibacterium halotolerans TaxID=517425 RepID=UPI000EB5D36D|nr:potassium channel family protein [Salisediminibacterium halotolerans]RLJ71654.1 ion channel [Actinophytocola xinjiangensis]RPE86804.1 ion channel [Salisediminibacterium halotolerans]TWG32867.1 ion channel [Salisediminibacterium halotolerans]GEL06959.1 hypothetical protein SHA02_03750 [Salisediminibacterium halotolerans]
MVSFLLTLRRMLKAVKTGLKEPEFRVLLTLTAITLLSGTIFYSTVEGLRSLDALYFSVVTLTTVGYGDFTPQTDFGKIFTIIYMFAGIGIIVGFVTKLFEYSQKNRLEKSRVRHEKKHPDDHEH